MNYNRVSASVGCLRASSPTSAADASALPDAVLVLGVGRAHVLQRPGRLRAHSGRAAGRQQRDQRRDDPALAHAVLIVDVVKAQIPQRRGGLFVHSGRGVPGTGLSTAPPGTNTMHPTWAPKGLQFATGPTSSAPLPCVNQAAHGQTARTSVRTVKCVGVVLSSKLDAANVLDSLTTLYRQSSGLWLRLRPAL
jgi:hypothetical protein